MLKAYNSPQQLSQKIQQNLSKYYLDHLVNPLSKFIVAKKQATIARGSKSVMKMAMEQGAVILMSEGSEDDDLCVSGNHFEEVVISKTGKIINAEHEI